MPGVPSGKGCDACRKQKKKCDQAKPSCARCTRLSIPCVGGGKQRYKFKVQVLEQQMVQTTKPVKSHAVQRACVQVNPLAVVPRSRTTVIAVDFISKLEISDARYDLTCYGHFLQSVPERLGTNKALDAAVDAFTTAGSTLYSDRNSVVSLSKYGNALKALRDCLNDPVHGKTVDTMCAIYLIMVVQGWIGTKEEDGRTHAEGLACLLQATAGHKWQGAFEMEIIVTMCVPVIVESMVNPRINLHPWLWDMLDNYRPPQPLGPERPDHEQRQRGDPGSFPSLKMRNLARFPDFLSEPQLHHLDILSTYHMLRFDCVKLHRRANTPAPTDLTSPEGVNLARLHRSFQVAYAMALSLALIANTILQGFDQFDVALAKESASCINELIRLADTSLHLRPLGASHIPIGLAIGWAATSDPDVRGRLSTLIEEFQQDFKTTNWMRMAYWWKVKFRNGRIRILAQEGKSPPECDWLALAVEEEAAGNDCAVQ
ncbi:hypothetical protein QQX98_009130 [Neonectria punicea]|uniref:Zn(2)-C6 fungal-type domain-containing protein n=1 Tax=Neonectria punicea TaxID=979145 RepID=A0ABR1GTQ1_9HYPO